jgi:hypothetical protein
MSHRGCWESKYQTNNRHVLNILPVFDCWISLCDATSLSCCFSSLPFITATAESKYQTNNRHVLNILPVFDCWISLCDATSLSCCFSSLPFITATADGPEHINATSTKTIRRIVCRFAGQVGDLFFLVICLGLIAGYFLHNANQ